MMIYVRISLPITVQKELFMMVRLGCSSAAVVGMLFSPLCMSVCLSLFISLPLYLYVFLVLFLSIS